VLEKAGAVKSNATARSMKLNQEKDEAQQSSNAMIVLFKYVLYMYKRKKKHAGHTKLIEPTRLS